MRRHVFYLAAGLLLSCMSIQAQIPSTLSFQGVLGDGAGQAMADGSYALTFRLYTQAMGGTPLWTETQTLDVNGGVFNAQLGSVTALTPTFDKGYWLGVSVDGSAELVPRTALLSVPYALRAGHAESADALATGASGVVTSVNDAEGAVTLEGAGGTTVIRSGTKITISSTGGSGGTGIQGVQNTNQTLDIIDGSGPVATINVSGNGIRTAHLADGAVTVDKISGMGATSGQVLVYNGSNVHWAMPPSGGVSGSGAANQLALWNGASSLNGNANLVLSGGKLGVGTSMPSASLHVSGNEGLMVQGIDNSGMALSPGPGRRLHWYSKKAAFRAGSATGTEWDDSSIGAYSTATGQGTTASAAHSTAMGLNCTASGVNSFAIGGGTTASGGASTAMGDGTTASGSYSTAMGYNSTASGTYSNAIGVAAIASGNYSSAIGSFAIASGENAVAFGKRVTAQLSGSMVIGDASTDTPLTASTSQQMSMRFHGGYRLYSNSGLTTGVYMNGGASGWTNYSDRNKKENFNPVDGEALLGKIRALPVTEWNYKETDPSIRYIGPMAQDFWQAFQLGGTDSLGINSIAIDGVNLAAVKALEARTAELREKTARITELEAAASENRSRIRELEAQLRELADLRPELEAIKTLLREQISVPVLRQASMPHPEQ